MQLPAVLPLLSLPLLWLLLGLLFGLAYAAIGRMVRPLPPQLRSLFLTIYSMLPLFIAGAVALLVFTPALGGFNLSGHCHGLDCAAHVPVLQTDPLSASIIYGAMLLTILATGFILTVSVWRNYRVLGMLYRLSSHNLESNYSVLETPEPLACCIGIIRPQIVISRGVLHQASPDQLQVIVSHELAHACRLDNLRRLLASVATMVWPQYLRQKLLADIELANEQACDEHVAQLLGNRKVVADTIRAMSGWHATTTGVVDMAALQEARITLLIMQDEYDMAGWKPAMMVFAGSNVFVLMASDALHRAAEAVLTVVPVVN
jgi:hypothetical protein